MTCVVGMIDASGAIWFGADSRSTEGASIYDSNREKIWQAELHGSVILFGASGKHSVNQFIQHCAPLPDKAPDAGSSLVGLLAREWAPPLRERLIKQNLVKVKEGLINTEGALIIGCEKKLYHVDSTLAINELAASITSIGSGGKFGEGILWAFRHLKTGMKPEAQIRTAVEASAHYCSGVGGRIDILSA